MLLVKIERGDSLILGNVFLIILLNCLWENIKIMCCRRLRYLYGYRDLGFRREVWVGDKYLQVIGIERRQIKFWMQMKLFFFLKILYLEYQFCCCVLRSILSMFFEQGRIFFFEEYYLCFFLLFCWRFFICLLFFSDFWKFCFIIKVVEYLCFGCYWWGFRMREFYDFWNKWYELQVFF